MLGPWASSSDTTRRLEESEARTGKVTVAPSPRKADTHAIAVVSCRLSLTGVGGGKLQRAFTAQLSKDVRHESFIFQLVNRKDNYIVFL